MKLRETGWAFAVALALCVTTAFAQDQKQDSPPADPSAPIQPLGVELGGGYMKKPAGAARGFYDDYDSRAYDPSQVSPDQNTLAGAQTLGLGSLEHSHNIFDPSISASQQGRTLGTTYGQSAWYPWYSVTMVGGSLNFDRTWSRYHLTTSYSGGDSYNMSQIPPNGMFHDLLIVQQADWDRWHILLRDDFRAAPGASFTGQGMGGPGLIGQFSPMLTASMSTLSPAFIPSETIDTGNTMRYRNSLLGQAEYSFSRRSVFTFSGSYGLLHFASTGYFSSQMLNAQVGYDYLLDPSNSIAILGSYGKIDYTGITNTITNYMAALAYGRKITGRLAFQIAAGPQQIRSAGGDANFQLWVTSVNSALSYERRRGGLTLHFMRGLTSGSGVFVGATSNTISSSAHYHLTRFWMGNLNAGYALNKSLPIAGAPTRNFDTWFFGANVGRRLGSHVRFNLNYGLQRQNNPAVCPVTYCGPTGFQQTVGVTANWHLRPVE